MNTLSLIFTLSLILLILISQGRDSHIGKACQAGF